MLGAIRVAIDWLSIEVSGKMEFGCGVAGRETCVPDGAVSERDARAERPIPVLVVERQDSISGMMGAANGETGDPARRGSISVDVE